MPKKRALPDRPKVRADAVARVNQLKAQLTNQVARRVTSQLSRSFSFYDDWLDPVVGLRGRFNPISSTSSHCLEHRSRSDSNSRKLKSSEFLRLALRRAMMKIPASSPKYHQLTSIIPSMPRFNLSRRLLFPWCFFLTAWLGGTLLVGCAPFASVGVSLFPQPRWSRWAIKRRRK